MKSPFRKRTEMGSGRGDTKASSRVHLKGQEKEGLAPQAGAAGQQDKSRSPHVESAGPGKSGRSGVSNAGKDQGHARSRTALENTGMADIREKPMPPSTDERDYRPVTKGGYDYLGHFANPRVLKEGHNTMSLPEAFHELKTNPPAVLAKTRAKKGAARANEQRVAIAFSKAGQSKSKGNPY